MKNEITYKFRMKKFLEIQEWYFEGILRDHLHLSRNGYILQRRYSQTFRQRTE